MNQKMKYILLLILAVAVTIYGYTSFEKLGEIPGSMVVAGGLAVSLYSGIVILRL